jgi:hypothetical protein
LISKYIKKGTSGPLSSTNKKFIFGQATTLEYLGHIIWAEGVIEDPKNIEFAYVVMAYTYRYKGLRGFLGLMRY